MAEQIRGYRGGYLPLRRREIEKGLREGQVRGVVSTNALELGIDIGALDVSIMAGYPGTIAATWQRAGRAGRRTARSAAVMVASSAPVDQFVVKHPIVLLRRLARARAGQPRQPAHPGRPREVRGLRAAVQRHRHLRIGGRAGGAADPARERPRAPLRRSRRRDDPGQWHWTSESYPADAVSLRSITSDNFVVVDVGAGAKVIGETDYTSGPTTLHPKAIYIVEGRLYQVEALDYDNRKAFVRDVDCDYYTTAISYSKVTVLDIAAGAGAGAPRTATCTCRRGSWASRRSSSTPTRTSARASSICPSSRCTRPPTGCRCRARRCRRCRGRRTTSATASSAWASR